MSLSRSWISTRQRFLIRHNCTFRMRWQWKKKIGNSKHKLMNIRRKIRMSRNCKTPLRCISRTESNWMTLLLNYRIRLPSKAKKDRIRMDNWLNNLSKKLWNTSKQLMNINNSFLKKKLNLMSSNNKSKSNRRQKLKVFRNRFISFKMKMKN